MSRKPPDNYWNKQRLYAVSMLSDRDVSRIDNPESMIAYSIEQQLREYVKMGGDLKQVTIEITDNDPSVTDEFHLEAMLIRLEGWTL